MRENEEENNNDNLKAAAVAGGGAAVGGAVAGVSQSAAGALVPWAMSTFGTVVPGVGTIHAAGGAAATLQSFAAMSAGPLVAGGVVVGAAAGLLVYSGKKAWNKPSKERGRTAIIVGTSNEMAFDIADRFKNKGIYVILVGNREKKN